MQAAWRGAIAEVARGFSTGFICWAGAGHQSCVCSCPELPRCPDCICQGSSRHCEAEQGFGGLTLVVLGAACLLLGFWAGRASATKQEATTCSAPAGQSEVPAVRGESEAESKKLVLKEEAQAQLQLIRQRRA